jgi:hypothetical protein
MILMISGEVENKIRGIIPELSDYEVSVLGEIYESSGDEKQVEILYALSKAYGDNDLKMLRRVSTALPNLKFNAFVKKERLAQANSTVTLRGLEHRICQCSDGYAIHNVSSYEVSLANWRNEID